MSINKVIISGNLTRDAQLSATPSGTSVMNFGVAVNDRRKNQTTGEWEDKANFIECEMFGPRAKPLSNLMVKGTKVTVEGRLDHQQWRAKDGTSRSRIMVLATEVELMGKPTARQVVEQAYPEARFDAYAEEDLPF